MACLRWTNYCKRQMGRRTLLSGAFPLPRLKEMAEAQRDRAGQAEEINNLAKGRGNGRWWALSPRENVALLSSGEG